MIGSVGQFGEYSVIEKLEESNYAVVYKTKDAKDNLVILKIARDNKINEIIIREFKILSQFRHPNIIQVYDYGQTEDARAFFTLEYITGQPINKHFHDCSKEFLLAILQVIEALGTIHEKGFVHSDLKLEHVLYIPEQKKVVLIDFGFAHEISQNVMLANRKTGLGGTIGYIAPEVLKGIGFDARADLYSLGIIMYETIAGVKPREIFKPIPGLAEELNNVLAALLSKEPALRPTLSELTAIFSKYLPAIELKESIYKVTLPKTGFVKITEIFDTLSNYRGEAFIVFGDTGTGKTRLLKELKFKFLMDGCDVLFYNSRQEFYFHDALCQFIGIEKLGTSNYENRLQIYDEILNRLLHRTAQKYTIIMVDDIETLSDYELGLYRYIGHGIKDSNVILIGASKPDPRIENMGFRNLVIRPFDLNETRELLEKTFLKIELLTQFAKWLHEHSGGNPLFTVEIINHLYKNNLLYYKSGIWFVEAQSLKRIKNFPKIEELLQNRLNNLDNNERTILKVLSLCPIPLGMPILEQIIESEIYINVEHLKNTGLLKEEKIDDQVLYTLPNKIMKEITNNFITEQTEKTLQDKLLKTIEKLAPGDGKYILCRAELYDALGNKRKAAAHYFEAGQNAEKIYDYDSAIKYYEKQAECIKHTESEKYPETLIKIANLNQLLGNNGLAVDYYNRARACKKQNSEKEIYLGLGFTYSTMGEHKEAVKYFERAINLMTDKKTKDYIHAINFLGYSMLHLNKFNDAESLFNESLTIASAIKNLEMQAESRYYQAVFEWFRNNYDKGIENAKKNLEFAKNNHLLKQYAYAANLLSSFYQQKNNLKEAQKYLDEAIATFEKLKHINALCGALNSQAHLYREQGNFTEAKELFKQTRMRALQIGNQVQKYISLINLAIINTRIGRFNEAIIFFEKAFHIYSYRQEPVYGMTMVMYKKGEIGKAKSFLEQKIKTDKEILYYFGLALIDLVLGQHDDADKLINEGLKKADIENPDTETKVEIFLVASQYYYEKADFEKSLNYAHGLKKLTNPLSREYNIASAFITIDNYNLKKMYSIDIEKELVRLKEINCLFDWAWLKRLCIESIINRGVEPYQIKLIAQELDKIETIFKSLGAGLEFKRIKKIKEILYPIIVRDYSRRVISTQYLEMLSRLALLISQHLGDKDFFNNTLDLVIQTTGAERGALFIMTTKRMNFVAGRNIDRTTIKDARELSKTAIEAINKEQIIFTADAINDPDFSTKKSVMFQQIHSLICLPLVVAEKIIGAIYLDSRISLGLFGPEDKDFLTTVAQILGSVIEKSLDFKQITDENILLKSKILSEIGTGYLLGKSRQMILIYKQIDEIALTDSPVLITGETGTGKGMIARLIHLRSKRRNKKFLSINCGTITETLFESELFGHKKGSFTGAISDKNGLLEEAEAGTVFLDEITNTSIAFQAKLLEAIEDKIIRRVGETNTKKIDVRFLFATNKDLELEVEEGRFRKDLFYRIHVFKIEVPPLREREKDIPLLAQFFLERYRRETNKKIEGFSPDALERLKQHFWPGNVRELQNVIERAVIRAKNSIIIPKDLGFDFAITKELITPLKEVKKEAVIEALNASNWHLQKAAKMLGIDRKTLYRCIKKYKIQMQ